MRYKDCGFKIRGKNHENGTHQIMWEAQKTWLLEKIAQIEREHPIDYLVINAFKLALWNMEVLERAAESH